MDWIQIEKDFEKWGKESYLNFTSITAWFKQRIESELPPPPLTEEEKSEFYTTDLTSDIKANYGK